jgi:predicted dehydrogenase
MSRVSRRQFIKGSLFVATAAAAHRTWAQEAPAITSTKSPNSKLNTAVIGCGGRGGAHVGPASEENLVAVCDVNKPAMEKVREKHSSVKMYTDYRKLYDEMGKSIDAVFVATPDHNHAPASMLFLRAGKACYTEKPMTWCVGEARAMAEMAAEKKVATQMGNQGHANQGNRKIVEWIRDGAVGEVTEVHTWTNRPIWPQGPVDRGTVRPVPDTLDWDCWLGPAPKKDYTEVQDKDKWHSPIVGFKWRGWLDYGCGAIGDMGCHTWDNVFWSMQPDYPESLELLDIKDPGTETFAKQTKFKWVFPAKGNRKGFTAFWYSGGMKPEMPEELANDPSRKQGGKKPEMPGSGCMYIGTKGKLFITGDYGDSPRLIPEQKMKDFMEERKDKTSPNAIEPSPGHHKEYLMAARGEKPWNFPKSNFAEYSGPLTEVMLLGCICEKIGKVGFKIECDPVKRVVLTKEALALVNREYRSGWKL